MNADQLLAQYDRIADAPDAIPRLRRFILDLAVRGKLVPQEPDDEPASGLLKRIEAARDRHRNGGTKKPKRERNAIAADIPHPVPQTWLWVRVGDIFAYDAGTKRNPRDLWADRWLLELEDIEKDTSAVLTRPRVSDRDSRSTKSEFQVGDILYGKLRPYLNKVVVADELGYSTTEIVAIRPYLPLCSAYCALAFRRPDFVEYVTRLGQGTKMPRLRAQDAIAAVFPLPPLAEQHRIVARVDELMALCDRLEAAREAQAAARDRLAAASLARLNRPDSDPKTFRDHAGFTLKTFVPLTTRPDQIKALRQTILNLAVRGKLVPQDPNDEPATELLKRITNERDKLVKVEGLKPPKAIARSDIGTEPFSSPVGWTWVRFGELIQHSESGWSPRTENFQRTGAEWGVLKVSAVSWDRFLPSENKQLLPNVRPRLQAQVHKGDFLISRANTSDLVAKCVIVDQEPHYLMLSDKIVRLRLTKLCDDRFVLLVNNGAVHSRTHYAENASGVSPSMKNISRPVIFSLPFPLPPLAEQHRIVAKVDELMALCDRLEVSLTTTNATRRRLLDAILHEALAPEARNLEAAE